MKETPIMPPKKVTPCEVSEPLRENEARFIKAIFDHMIDKPNTDWSKVAEDMGLKGVKSAKDRFYNLSVRQGWGNQAAPGSGSGSNGSNGSSPVKGAGKKAATLVGSEGKVTKKPRMPKKVIKKEEGDERAGDEEPGVGGVGGFNFDFA